MANILRGASPRPIKDKKWFDTNSRIGWIRISDVTSQNGRVYTLGQHLSKKGQEKTRVVSSQTLLLSIAASVGYPVITYVETGVHDGFVIFDKPKFNLDFMFFKLQSIQNIWNKYGQAGSQVNINSSIVANTSISIPNIEEQKRISILLKKIEENIYLQQRKLEQLKMIQKIIAYNLVASHSLKKTNTVAWKTKYLKNIAKIYQPTTITQNDLLDIGIPVFGANNYIGFYSKANHDTDQVTICARGANTGNPSYVKGPVWITGNSMVINVNENSVNKRFLYTLLTFTDLKRFVTGGAQPQITRESLNSLKLALPSIKTQNDLSVILGKLNIEVQNIQFYNNSLKKLKQSLLRNMFI